MKSVCWRIIGVLTALLLAAASMVRANAGVATSLSVTVAPPTLSCGGGASFVTVVAKDSSGAQVPAGTIFLTTDLGSISPTSSTDDLGIGVVAVLTAPANNAGVATVTVTGGGLTATATAIVTCSRPPKDACKRGGWRRLTREGGNVFRNQGDCVRYVNAG